MLPTFRGSVWSHSIPVGNCSQENVYGVFNCSSSGLDAAGAEPAASTGVTGGSCGGSAAAPGCRAPGRTRRSSWRAGLAAAAASPLTELGKLQSAVSSLN